MSCKSGPKTDRNGRKQYVNHFLRLQILGINRQVSQRGLKSTSQLIGRNTTRNGADSCDMPCFTLTCYAWVWVRPPLFVSNQYLLQTRPVSCESWVQVCAAELVQLTHTSLKTLLSVCSEVIEQTSVQVLCMKRWYAPSQLCRSNLAPRILARNASKDSANREGAPHENTGREDPALGATATRCPRVFCVFSLADVARPIQVHVS